MKSITTYITEKLILIKPKHKFKTYTEMVNDLIKQNMDGFCLIEKSTENIIEIYKKSFDGYRESLEDLYKFSDKNKDIEFIVYCGVFKCKSRCNESSSDSGIGRRQAVVLHY
jgi:hypothetical protein